MVLAGSLNEALTMLENDDEVFICGGASVYKEAMPLCDRLYLTVIERDFEGDTRFNFDGTKRDMLDFRWPQKYAFGSTDFALTTALHVSKENGLTDGEIPYRFEKWKRCR